MKNLIYLAIIPLFLASCSEEPTTPVDGNNSTITIEGVWNFDKVEQLNGTMTILGTEVGTFSAESSNETGTFDFKSDGTLTSTVSYTQTTTIVFGGVPQETTNDVPTTTSTGTYTYDDGTKVLTITSGGNTQTAEVTELTANKMVYKMEYSVSQTNQGVTTVSSADVVTTLTR
jgi:hypothetical protein